MKLNGTMRTTIRITLAGMFGGLAITVADTARAEDPPAPDQPTPATAQGHAIDRTWLYVDDAKLPPVFSAIAMSSVSYTTVGSNPDPTSAPYRAFAFNTAQPGALVSLGGEVGLLPWLSLAALGQAELAGASGATSPGAVAGLRLRLSPESWQNVHLVASGGYLRETWSGPVRNDAEGGFTAGQAHGDDGVWAEAGVSADVRQLRLGLTAHGEHVFVDGRDGVDVMLKAGASYRIVDGFRAGVEWVGQDLEETVKDAAEGGPRHFVGPTASVQLLQNRLTLVAGPSLGLSTGSPKLLGRLAVAYGF